MIYGFEIRLRPPNEQVADRVTPELNKEGCGILADMDAQGTVRQKLGVQRPRYWILGARNPPSADRALGLRPNIGLLLPCKVVVREDSDGSVVVCIDPAAVLGPVGRAELCSPGEDVRSRLERVRDAARVA